MVGSNTDTQRRTATLTVPGLRVIFFAILAIVLMAIDHRGNDLDGLRRSLGIVVYPVQATVSLPSRFIDWSARSTISRADLERENNSLKVERLRTRAELQRFNELRAENERLRAMLKASDAVADNFSMAEIMEVQANPFQHGIVINKGSRRGVYEGQAMVDATGVVGQVLTVGPFSSDAVLISDANHALPVEVVRNGLRTIARGTGDFDRLELPFLPNNADVVVGDQLVTSGLGGAFPSGYPVATVSRIELRPGQPFARLEAVPAARLNQVREIVLIAPAKPDPDDSANETDSTPDEESAAETPTEVQTSENTDAGN